MMRRKFASESHSEIVRLLGRLVAWLWIFVAASCTSQTSEGGSNGPSCVTDGSVITCSGTTYPLCTGPNSGACDPDASATCAGCNGPAGYTCSCQRGDAGWVCVGTGGPCH
jgi:hypothetical protein